MEGILLALGWQPGFRRQTGLISLFAFMTLAALIVVHVAHLLLQWNPLALHIASWVIWLAWLRWLFPLNRERYLRADPSRAYRQAFYTDILPGVAGAFSQMARPAFYGLILGPNWAPWWRFVVGACFILSGFALIVIACKAIGVTQVLFVPEYQPAIHPLKSYGVYAYIRHPLFLGGMAISVGAGLLFNDGLPLALAVLNLAVLPIYCWFEDARCIRVFGLQSLSYIRTVGGFVPRLTPLRHHAARHLDSDH